MRFCDVWIEQCEAAKQIEAEFGNEEEAAEIDAEDVEDLRQDALRRSADGLLLVEQARGWLMGEGD